MTSTHAVKLHISNDWTDDRAEICWMGSDWTGEWFEQERYDVIMTSSHMRYMYLENGWADRS